MNGYQLPLSEKCREECNSLAPKEGVIGEILAVFVDR